MNSFCIFVLPAPAPFGICGFCPVWLLASVPSAPYAAFGGPLRVVASGGFFRASVIAGWLAS